VSSLRYDYLKENPELNSVKQNGYLIKNLAVDKKIYDGKITNEMIFSNSLPLFYYSKHRFHASPNNIKKIISRLRLKTRKENYGDLLSKYIVEKISKKKVRWHDPRKNKKKVHYFAIGSLLAFTNSKSIVWGSGIIDKKDSVANCSFLAVRGPQTRKRLKGLGYHCPPVYGDPAILLPLFFKPKVEVVYEVGIVPHYRDFNRAKNLFGKMPGIKIINLLTNDIEETTREILSCRKVISSSLHGIVIAHTYNIPAVWIKLSNQLHGDGIKFQDYLESVGLSNYEGGWISNIKELQREIERMDFNNSLPDKRLLKTLRAGLMDSSPFN